jgi:hypothetical protein
MDKIMFNMPTHCINYQIYNLIKDFMKVLNNIYFKFCKSSGNILEKIILNMLKYLIIFRSR